MNFPFHVVYHYFVTDKKYTSVQPTTTTSQLRIPSRPIRTLQRLLPAIPKQRTQLEPLLPTTNRMHRALMPEVHVLPDNQPLRVLVRQNRRAGSTRLANDVGRARVVEEAVVDAARVPGVDAARPTERRVTNQRVAAAVPVSRVGVEAVMVLLQ